jgi:hypothetical protein
VEVAPQTAPPKTRPRVVRASGCPLRKALTGHWQEAACSPVRLAQTGLTVRDLNQRAAAGEFQALVSHSFRTAATMISASRSTQTSRALSAFERTGYIPSAGLVSMMASLAKRPANPISCQEQPIDELSEGRPPGEVTAGGAEYTGVASSCWLGEFFRAALHRLNSLPGVDVALVRKGSSESRPARET